jgi:uncharacterized membrane protein
MLPIARKFARSIGLAGALGALAASASASTLTYEVVPLPLPDGMAGAALYAIDAGGNAVGAASIGPPSYANAPFYWDATGAHAIPLLPGASEGEALGMSDTGGWIAGRAYSSYRAWAWDGTTLHEIFPTAGSYAQAFDVNASGIAVGGASSASSIQSAFYWDGTTHDLGVLPNTIPGGGGQSIALAINDAGMITGGSSYGDQFLVAMTWDAVNGMRPIPAPAYITQSEGTAINALGHVVGYYYDDRGQGGGFFWDGTTWISTPGALWGINDQDMAVGEDWTGAFVWTPSGGTTYLPVGPDASWSSARAINADGTIAGFIDGTPVLWKPAVTNPVPEPASAALAVMALGAIVLGRRPRR